MTDNQENKLTSYEASEAVLEIDDHRAIIAEVEEFRPYVERFKSLLGDIRTIRMVQETSTKGKAITKSKFRDNLTNVTYKVITGLKTYARITW